MAIIPNLKQAEELLREYNQEEFHIYHAMVVAGVMKYFASEYDPERVDFWEAVGLLHDLDFENWPEQPKSTKEPSSTFESTSKQDIQ